jgi:hypothetical protein
MRTNRIIRAAVAVSLVFSALGAFAQSGPPPGPGGPIDGGASLLVIGAAAYGYKKMRDKKKQVSGQ